jgi:Bacterial sugar transferase
VGPRHSKADGVRGEQERRTERLARHGRACAPLRTPPPMAHASCPQQVRAGHPGCGIDPHVICCARVICEDRVGKFGPCVVTLGALANHECPTLPKQDALAGFMHRVVITDLLGIIWAVWGPELIRFGPEGQVATASAGTTYFLDVRYDALTALLIVAWLLMLRLHGAHDRRLLGHGPEEYKVDLVVAPGLTDIAGPRALTRPVAGLSLLHGGAGFSGPRLAIKTTMDRLGAASLLMLASPLFAVVTFLVWRHDRRPVFFRQERIRQTQPSCRPVMEHANAALLSLV